MRLLPQASARRLVAQAAAAGVALRHPGRAVGTSTANRPMAADDVVATLRAQGCAMVEPILSPQQIADIHAFVAGKEIVTPKGSRCTVDTVADDVRRASYPLETVLKAPHVVDTMNRQDILEVAARYLGCRPTISGIGLHWSFPSQKGGHVVQMFHRDPDDWRFLKAFVYLTDVDEGTGPHEYIRGSHLHSGRVRSRPYEDQEVMARYGEQSIERVVGPAGTSFIADTWGIHKGRVAQTRTRLILQITYSILPVLKCEYRPVELPPRDDVDAYANRLLIA